MRVLFLCIDVFCFSGDSRLLYIDEGWRPCNGLPSGMRTVIQSHSTRSNLSDSKESQYCVDVLAPSASFSCGAFSQVYSRPIAYFSNQPSSTFILKSSWRSSCQPCG